MEEITKEELTMKITKGDKTIVIPGWALLVGALVVDNAICNVCKLISYKK